MRTRALKLFQFLSSRALIHRGLLVVLLALLVAPCSSFAFPLTIGGVAVEGDLRVTVEDDGSLFLEQFQGSVWVAQLSSTASANGSVLKSDLGLCYLGYNPTTSTTNAIPISHVIAGAADQISTIVDCPTSGLRWQQDVYYSSGRDDLVINWSITKMSGFSPTVATFWHTQGTNIDGATTASGFASSGVGLIGARNQTVSTVRGITLQAFDPPIAYYSGSNTGLLSSVAVGNSMSNFIDSTPLANALAFEWINPNIGIENVWNLGVSQQVFTAAIADDIYIIAPAPLNILIPGSVTFPFLLVNNDTVVKSVTLSTSASDPGWSTFLMTPTSPFSLSPQTSIDVFVSVGAPFTSLDGESSDITLTAISNSLSTNNVTKVTVKAFPPTPPNISPTIVPTAVPTMVAPTPTSIPDPITPSFTFPYNSTANRTPTLTGTAFPGAAVTIVLDGIAAGTVIADINGVWSFAFTTPLLVEEHLLTLSALDPIGRRNDLTTPFALLVTPGAELDFEGDGLSDLTSYTTLGSSVIFRNKPSSGGSSKVVSVKGAVPAAADYDGDTLSDFAAIRRSGKAFIWSIASSVTGQTTELTFGLRRDTLITGCHFASKEKHSLAVLRANTLFFNELGGSQVQQVANILDKSLSFLGCADVDGDGIDELIVHSGNSDQKIEAINLNKETKALLTVSDFVRGFLGRQPNETSAVLLAVRTEKAPQKSLEVIDLFEQTRSEKFILPRKIILGNGIFLRSPNGPENAALIQDLKTNKITRFFEDDAEEREVFATLARGARLVIPQYQYKTRD